MAPAALDTLGAVLPEYRPLLTDQLFLRYGLTGHLEARENEHD